MSAIDDEILLGAEEDAREIAFIREQLPQELKDRFSDDDLYYFLDVLIDYYISQGAFDENADPEGFVNIDLEQAAQFVVKKAKKEGIGEFDPADIFFVAQADFDFNSQEAEEEDDDEEPSGK